MDKGYRLAKDRDMLIHLLGLDPNEDEEQTNLRIQLLQAAQILEENPHPGFYGDQEETANFIRRLVNGTPDFRRGLLNKIAEIQGRKLQSGKTYIKQSSLDAARLLLVEAKKYNSDVALDKLAKTIAQYSGHKWGTIKKPHKGGKVGQSLEGGESVRRAIAMFGAEYNYEIKEENLLLYLSDIAGLACVNCEKASNPQHVLELLEELFGSKP